MFVGNVGGVLVGCMGAWVFVVGDVGVWFVWVVYAYGFCGLVCGCMVSVGRLCGCVCG